MDQRVGLFFLLAAGLLCLSLAPNCWAEDHIEDIQEDDVDVEDDLDVDLVGTEYEEEDQDEAPPEPKTPAAPKVSPENLTKA